MRNFLRRDEGQILLWVALIAGLLITFTGMAVDMANIYYHKARLSNAVDASVLLGVKLYGTFDNNNNQITQDTAQTYADDVFTANYGATCESLTYCQYVWCPRDTASCPVGSSTLSLQLTARAPVTTSFMAYSLMPNWKWAHWTIADVGQATRSTLVMSLVLDRSGSMTMNGGENALKAAVPLFVQNFIQGTDYIGMISFASHSSIDVSISNNGWGPWNSGPIYTKVQGFDFKGATFGGGAGSGTLYSTTNGPPLNLADAQNASVNLNNAPETKVVVYFTDGLMNTLQDQFKCGGTTTTLNYGGSDPAAPGEGSPYRPEAVYSLNPAAELNTYYCYDPSNDPDHGSYTTCSTVTLPKYDNSSTCQYNNTNAVFPSEEYPRSSPLAMVRWNVTNEAKYRALYTANQMRMETPHPNYIYVIGLGNGVAGDACTKAFLATLANDPDAATYNGGSNCDSGNGVYNQNLPDGLLVLAPDCPGTGNQCVTELEAAFTQIANRVLLRLSL